MSNNNQGKLMDPEMQENASNKLAYHVAQYVETAIRLSQHEQEPEFHYIVANAIEDSHAVHARILIEFLRGRKVGNDIIAIDFYSDPKNTGSFPLPNAFLDIEKKEIEKKLIHFTDEKLPKLIAEITWSRKEIAKELLPILKVFLNDADADWLLEPHRTQCKDNLAKYP